MPAPCKTDLRSNKPPHSVTANVTRHPSFGTASKPSFICSLFNDLQPYGRRYALTRDAAQYLPAVAGNSNRRIRLDRLAALWLSVLERGACHPVPSLVLPPVDFRRVATQPRVSAHAHHLPVDRHSPDDAAYACPVAGSIQHV